MFDRAIDLSSNLEIVKNEVFAMMIDGSAVE
jgi:hypothetical protein